MVFDKDYITKNKSEAIKELENYLNQCILSDKTHQKKANLISFWLKDYTKYLSQEEHFNSSTLKHYSRGDVIKANLGFNIGNEEGGLHYCIVLDKINARAYSTLTVVPLTSLKPNKKINNTSVFLGNELNKSITNKAHLLLDSIDKEKAIHCQNKIIKNWHAERIVEEITDDEILAMEDFKNKYEIIQKIISEAEQMKAGSIALVNQITTISKQRIYDPKNNFDILAGIKISDNYLDLIDKKIKELFLKNE